MSMRPIWGTKCWRTLTIIIAVLLLAWGVLTMVTDFLSGYQLWLYTSTIVFYAIALFGLVLLVKEGLDAFNNVMKYGRNPDKSEWEHIDDSDDSIEDHTEYIRTYDESE